MAKWTQRGHEITGHEICDSGWEVGRGKRDASRGFRASYEDVQVARRGQQRLTELRHLCDTTVSFERPKDGDIVTFRAISSRVSGIRDLARSIPRPSSPPIQSAALHHTTTPSCILLTEACIPALATGPSSLARMGPRRVFLLRDPDG